MTNLKDFIEETLRKAGSIVNQGFEKVQQVSVKENQSNVLTETDIECERYLVSQIQSNFPDESIIAEESGFINQSSPFTWIVDPIDGTSNYAVGLPWFGIMYARLENWIPVICGIYLPVINEMYFAQKDRGSTLNGLPIHVTSETQLANVLVNYQIDYSPDQKKLQRELEMIKILVENGRNLRITNSCIDFCMLASGKIGVGANQCAKIWDVAPLYLLITEAGGVYTDINGKQIRLLSDSKNFTRNFSSLAAPPILHKQLQTLLHL